MKPPDPITKEELDDKIFKLSEKIKNLNEIYHYDKEEMISYIIIKLLKKS